MSVAAASSSPRTEVRVRIRHPAHHDPDGHLVVDPEALEWVTVPWLPAVECEHLETACADCLGSWTNDWEVMGVPGRIEDLAQRAVDLVVAVDGWSISVDAGEVADGIGDLRAEDQFLPVVERITWRRRAAELLRELVECHHDSPITDDVERSIESIENAADVLASEADK